MKTYGMFDDFVKEKDFDEETIEKYKGKIPNFMTKLWKKYGMGSFFRGYFRMINPEEYQEIVDNTYDSPAETIIPLFVTSFGDIITWEDEEYLCILLYRYGRMGCITTEDDDWFDWMSDSDDKDFRQFTLKKHREALEKYGEPAFDECYGYVQILALGGSEKVENIKKVKTKEHIYLINQFEGNIQDK